MRALCQEGAPFVGNGCKGNGIYIDIHTFFSSSIFFMMFCLTMRRYVSLYNFCLPMLYNRVTDTFSRIAIKATLAALSLDTETLEMLEGMQFAAITAA